MSVSLLELRNIIACAKMIVAHSLRREINQGVFYKIDYLKEQAAEYKLHPVSRNNKEALSFAKQLLNGIEYYRTISNSIAHKQFLQQLNVSETEINNICSQINKQ